MVFLSILSNTSSIRRVLSFNRQECMKKEKQSAARCAVRDVKKAVALKP